MISIPSALCTQLDERLIDKAIPKKTHWLYIRLPLKLPFGPMSALCENFNLRNTSMYSCD